MKTFRPLLLAASALTFSAACSQLEDAAISPSPQYGTFLEDYATHVATNEKGYLYTLGTSRDYDAGETRYDEAILKRFSTSSRELWSRELGGGCDVDAGTYPFGCRAFSHGASTDNAGNSYALFGRWQDGDGADTTLRKLSASGTALWTQGVYYGHDLGAQWFQHGPVSATSAAGETFVAYYYNGSEAPKGSFLVIASCEKIDASTCKQRGAV